MQNNNKNYKTKEECEDNEHILIPQFLNTLIQAPELAGTSSLSDKNINPKPKSGQQELLENILNKYL